MEDFVVGFVKALANILVGDDSFSHFKANVNFLRSYTRFNIERVDASVLCLGRFCLEASDVEHKVHVLCAQAIHHVLIKGFFHHGVSVEDVKQIPLGAFATRSRLVLLFLKEEEGCCEDGH